VKKSWCLAAVVAALCGSLTVPAPEPARAAEAPEPAARRSGKVLEAIEASNYSYVHVNTGAEEVWLAGPKVQVKPGDRVVFPSGMLMTDFKSKALGRTFDRLFFVDWIQPEGAEPVRGGLLPGHLPPGHPPTGPKADSAAAAHMDFSKITKAADGKTVAEIIQQKADLVGKKVSVRGKVIKYSADIMGKNWLHLNDGTVQEGAEDLTVTTTATAKVGDTVLVHGVVGTDKDFGFGYRYAVILEDAEVTVE